MITICTLYYFIAIKMVFYLAYLVYLSYYTILDSNIPYALLSFSVILVMIFLTWCARAVHSRTCCAQSLWCFVFFVSFGMLGAEVFGMIYFINDTNETKNIITIFTWMNFLLTIMYDTTLYGLWHRVRRDAAYNNSQIDDVMRVPMHPILEPYVPQNLQMYVINSSNVKPYIIMDSCVRINDVCAICLCNFDAPTASISEKTRVNVCRLNGCLHTYHVDCIDKWLSQSMRCPTCRHDISI